MVKTYRDLAKYISRHRTAFIVAAGLILVNGFFATLAPIIPGRVIDGCREGTMDMPLLLLHVAALSSSSPPPQAANVSTPAATMTRCRRVVMAESSHFALPRTAE